ncbi:MAG: hypothetical protein ACKVII_22245 [Planctomycetales bacterium]
MVSDVDGSGDPPTTSSDNATEGAPASLHSVRPADDGLSELQSEIESLRNRDEKMFEWRLEGDPLLDVALDHLTLGRTWQLSARLEIARSSGLSPSSPVASSDQEPSELCPDREISVVAESPYSQSEHHLTQSVTLLRQAGQQQELPHGLLHRAALWREMLDVGPVPTGPTDYLANAERDLSEAETIAERGSMLIWQIEAALERSRLFLTLAHPNFASSRRWVNTDATDDSREGARTQREWLDLAREKLDETKRLVKQTEKPYEPHVPDWEDWDPPEYVGLFKEGDIVGYHCRNDELKRLDREIEALSDSVG